LIIIVAMIIIQIIKAAKRAVPPTRPTSKPLGRGGEQKDEIQNFLDSLTAGVLPPTAETRIEPAAAARLAAPAQRLPAALSPPPPPPASAMQQPIRAAPVAARAKRVQRAGIPSRQPSVHAVTDGASRPDLTVPLPVSQVTKVSPFVGVTGTGVRTTGASDLAAQLRRSGSARRAILLREVLGTPVALRKSGTPFEPQIAR